jgi:hypothetical protein
MACSNAYSTSDLNTETELGHLDVETKVKHLVDLLPNIDPEFIEEKVLEFAGKDGAAFCTWIHTCLEKGVEDLPSRKDYEKRLKVRHSQNHYVLCFFFCIFCKVVETNVSRERNFGLNNLLRGYLGVARKSAFV